MKWWNDFRLGAFIFWGAKILGFGIIDIHTYEVNGEKFVDAVTFSTNEEYVEAVQKIEI